MWLSYIFLYWTFKLDCPHTQHSSYLAAVEENSHPAPYPSSCVLTSSLFGLLGDLTLFLTFSTRSTFPGSLAASSLQHLNVLQVSSTKNKTCRIRHSSCVPLQNLYFGYQSTKTLLHLVLSGIPSTAFYALLRVRLSTLLNVTSLSVK